jgi:hypothetical protein
MGVVQSAFALAQPVWPVFSASGPVRRQAKNALDMEVALRFPIIPSLDKTDRKKP